MFAWICHILNGHRVLAPIPMQMDTTLAHFIW